MSINEINPTAIEMAHLLTARAAEMRRRGLIFYATFDGASDEVITEDVAWALEDDGTFNTEDSVARAKALVSITFNDFIVRLTDTRA